jgi:hypothetical protein
LIYRLCILACVCVCVCACVRGEVLLLCHFVSFFFNFFPGVCIYMIVQYSAHCALSTASLLQ